MTERDLQILLSTWGIRDVNQGDEVNVNRIAQSFNLTTDETRQILIDNDELASTDERQHIIDMFNAMPELINVLRTLH